MPFGFHYCEKYLESFHKLPQSHLVGTGCFLLNEIKRIVWCYLATTGLSVFGQRTSYQMLLRVSFITLCPKWLVQHQSGKGRRGEVISGAKSESVCSRCLTLTSRPAPTVPALSCSGTHPLPLTPTSKWTLPHSTDTPLKYSVIRVWYQIRYLS